MSKMRELLNNNSMVMVGATVLLLCVAGWLLYKQIRGSGGGTVGATDVYYYDLDTGSLFTNKNDLYPPIDNPAGAKGKGVLAIVYGCGNCEEANRYIGYLQKYTDKAKAIWENPPVLDGKIKAPLEMMEPASGQLVASQKKPTQWHPILSSQGQMILNAEADKCKGTDRKYCTPQSK